MKRDNMTRASFDFLRKMAQKQMFFTLEELIEHSGWSKSTTKINISKKFTGVIKKVGSKYRVDRKILGVTYDRYASLFKQKRKLFVDYEKFTNPDVTVYEFFLPLTLEPVLRQALDDLFYKDTVKNRLDLIGIDEVAKIFNRKSTESDDNLLNRVCEFVGRKFVGYSISHVSGRFRADELLTKDEARKNEKDGESYIFDETTAVARFIIPHDATKLPLGKVMKNNQPQLFSKEINIQDEIERTEWLFRNLFVDTILQATTDQDEIWLLESGKNQRIYRFKALDRDD